MALPSHLDTRNTHALALLRIGVGLLFLIFGQYKVFGTAFTLHGGFQSWITNSSKAEPTRSWCPFSANLSCRMPRRLLSLWLTANSQSDWAHRRRVGAFGQLRRLDSDAHHAFFSDYPGAGAPFWQYFGAA